MARRVRRCAYIHCSKPLPPGTRSDKRFCDRACRAANRRWRRHQADSFAIGVAFILGEEPEQVVRCPVCGRRFALGHGHRRDKIFDRDSCRQSAFRARRRAEGVRETVTPDSTPEPRSQAADLRGLDYRSLAREGGHEDLLPAGRPEPSSL